MAGLVSEIVDNVIKSVLDEVLKKTGARTKTRRGKRQARSGTSGRFVRKAKASTTRKRKPARKQVSRRRTAAGRSRQRAR